jgi:hypothetical protein
MGGRAIIMGGGKKPLRRCRTMARSWKGIRRPVEDEVIRRERRSEPPAEWWRKWNKGTMGWEWAREKADEEAKARNLLRALMGQDDDEDERARRLARALGLLDGGDR